MTSASTPTRPNLDGASIHTPGISEAVAALPGLLRALSTCKPARDVIKQFNTVTYARFLRLGGGARSFGARHGCAAFSDSPRARSVLEESDAAGDAVVAAGRAWIARHHVSLAIAHATWGECTDAEYRAECRRCRIQAIGELTAALAAKEGVTK